MSNLNKYLELNYPMEIIEDPDEGGYVVSYPDLPGCITTGDTIEKAITNARNAKKPGYKLLLKMVLLLTNLMKLVLTLDNSNYDYLKHCIIN